MATTGDVGIHTSIGTSRISRSARACPRAWGMKRSAPRRDRHRTRRMRKSRAHRHNRDAFTRQVRSTIHGAERVSLPSVVLRHSSSWLPGRTIMDSVMWLLFPLRHRHPHHRSRVGVRLPRGPLPARPAAARCPACGLLLGAAAHRRGVCPRGCAIVRPPGAAPDRRTLVPVTPAPATRPLWTSLFDQRQVLGPSFSTRVHEVS